jgi:alcohol dehydrogenase
MRRRSLLLTAPYQVQWVDEELPSPQPDEILVQTTSGAISIGTELPQFCGTARKGYVPRYPHMMGYESVGTVVACGDNVSRFAIGDRVVAFYGHRTHDIVKEQQAILVPDDISDALALLTILTCDVTKGIRKVGPQPDEPVLVTGTGAIGLLTLFMLKVLGVQHVDVIEPQARRRAMARRLGARIAHAHLSQAISTIRYPVGIECSSRRAAFALLQDRLQHDGRICILSDGNLEMLALTPEFHKKELRVMASSDGWDYGEHAKLFFSVVRANPEQARNLEQLFEYETKADKLADTFSLLAGSTITPIKVLVHYG